MSMIRTNFNFLSPMAHGNGLYVLPKPADSEKIQDHIYYIPYKDLEDERISFADFALRKFYYNQLAFLFEDASVRKPHTDREVHFITTVARHYLQDSTSFLDIACGVGRHDRELSNQGYKVVGVDASEDLLEIARSKDNKTIYKRSDMRSFKLDQSFDCAFCLWDAFPYLSQSEDVEAFLEKSYKHLKKRGLLIIDFRNYFQEGLQPILIEQDFSCGPFEIKLTGIKHNINFADRVNESIFAYRVKDPIKGDISTYVDQELVRTYSLDDLKKLFRSNFKILDAFGDFDLKDKFDLKKSERLIVVAQRV